MNEINRTRFTRNMLPTFGRKLSAARGVVKETPWKLGPDDSEHWFSGYQTAKRVPLSEFVLLESLVEPIHSFLNRNTNEQEWGGEAGQRWRSGESTRTPLSWALFDFWSGRYMWVEFRIAFHCFIQMVLCSLDPSSL